MALQDVDAGEVEGAVDPAAPRDVQEQRPTADEADRDARGDLEPLEREASVADADGIAESRAFAGDELVVGAPLEDAVAEIAAGPAGDIDREVRWKLLPKTCKL